MKKKIGIAAAVVLVLIVGGFVYLTQSVSGAVKDGRILEGVECQGISLGGMTKEEAKEAVEDYIKGIHQEKIKFYVDDEEISIKIEDLGAKADADQTVEEAYQIGRSGSIFEKYSDVKEAKHSVNIYRSYDKKVFEDQIKKKTKNLISEPKNASVKRSNGTFVVIKEKTGYDLKMDQTFRNFKKAVETGEKQAKLAVTRKKAKYTSKDMEKIKDKLGTYSTYYGSSAYGRKVNVARGANKINGSVVYPGETFSVYEAVSPFTKENGYALAGSYENGQTVQSYGGGICQVSTTLYNAVIRAELEIKERYPHSMTVSYVPRSADAAIAGTYKDLKFKNPYDVPIYIEGSANGSTITFTVYGEDQDPDRTVEFMSETTSVKASAGEKIIKDPTLPEGQKILESSGHTGYTARLWKIVKVKGKQVEKKVFNNSSYMATASVYRVGTKKKDDKEDDKKDKKTTADEKTEKKKTTAQKKETTAAKKSSAKTTEKTTGKNQ